MAAAVVQAITSRVPFGLEPRIRGNIVNYIFSLLLSVKVSHFYVIKRKAA